MKIISKARMIAISAFAAGLSVLAAEPVAKVLFNEQFNSSAAGIWLKMPGGFLFEKDGSFDSSGCLKVINSKDAEAELFAIPIDMNAAKGKKILIEAKCKGAEISKPPADYLGVKFMINYKSPTTGEISVID